MISSYEEYMLKSHLLSKMYLQQYCNAGLNIAKNSNNPEKTVSKVEKPSKAGDAEGRRGRRKEERPLDLSVPGARSLEHHQQALKDHPLYPHNFPFASLQQMLLQSASQEGKVQPGGKKAEAGSAGAGSQEAGDREASKELSYVCPICGQMFGLHDRYPILPEL